MANRFVILNRCQSGTDIANFHVLISLCHVLPNPILCHFFSTFSSSYILILVALSSFEKIGSAARIHFLSTSPSIFLSQNYNDLFLSETQSTPVDGLTGYVLS